MTKKHFIALAFFVKNCPVFGKHQINALADFCETQNVAFNRQRWLDYIAGKCGPNGGSIGKTNNT